MTEGDSSRLVGDEREPFSQQCSWKKPTGNILKKEVKPVVVELDVEDTLNRRIGDSIIDIIEDAVGESLGSPGRSNDRWITLAELYTVLKSALLEDEPANEIPEAKLQRYITAREQLKEVIPPCHHYVFGAPETVFSMAHRLRHSQLIYSEEAPPLSSPGSPRNVTVDDESHDLDSSLNQAPIEAKLSSISIPPPPPTERTSPQDISSSIHPKQRQQKVQVQPSMLISAVDLHRMFEPRVVIKGKKTQKKGMARGGRRVTRQPSSSFVPPTDAMRRSNSRSKTSPLQAVNGTVPKKPAKQPMERSATDLSCRSGVSRGRSSSRPAKPISHPPWTNRVVQGGGNVTNMPFGRSTSHHVRMAKPIIKADHLTPQSERALARRRARERSSSERAKDPPPPLHHIGGQVGEKVAELMRASFPMEVEEEITPQTEAKRRGGGGGRHASSAIHAQPTYSSAPVMRWRSKSGQHDRVKSPSRPRA